AIGDKLEVDMLTFIESAQPGALHSRNVHKHVLPTTLRLNKAVALGRIEPLHSPASHHASPGSSNGGQGALSRPALQGQSTGEHEASAHLASATGPPRDRSHRACSPGFGRDAIASGRNPSPPIHGLARFCR